MTLAIDAPVTTPFFFGDRGRRLYGVYHPAARRSGPGRAAVLCNPWGHEYFQAHRSVRLLADMLAGAGVHALRFDYFGTGDSGGDLADGDIGGWCDDILVAVEELGDISGARRMTVAGLRMGALLAASAATRRGSGIAEVVLWDPLLTGADSVEEVIEFAARHAYAKLLPAARQQGAGGGHEVFGFPVSEAFRREAAALSLTGVAGTLTVPAHLVVSGEARDFAAAKDALSHVTLASVAHVPAAPPWMPGAHFVPRTVLAAIVDAMTGPV